MPMQPEALEGAELEPTQADLVRNAVRDVYLWARDAQGLSNDLVLSLGITCGAAMRSLEHWPTDADDITAPPDAMDFTGEFDQ